MSSRAIIEVIDNLNSESTTDALSANQGRVLKEMIGNSSIISLVGTSSKPIVLSNLNTGIYIITGVYKYSSLSNAVTNTSEHLLFSVYHTTDYIDVLLVSPTAVFRRIRIDSTGTVFNHLFRLTEDDFVYNGKSVATIDSSWKSITLKSGITAHNASDFPVRCKKQGNVVYLEGAVKGVTARACDIGTLPENYRPVGKLVYFVQARTGGKIDTYKISRNGLIEITASTADTFNASDYHFISTSFII